MRSVEPVLRLFVAVEPPDELRAAVSSAVSDLRDDFPEARWVPQSNLHLTLKFLGDVSSDEVAPLCDRLRGAVGDCTALRLTVDRAGVFPPAGRARVLWLGLAGGDALRELQARVDRATGGGPAGAGDRRPFTPHLTVGRARKPWLRRAARRWCQAFDRALRPESTTPCPIAETVLFESRLRPEGADHVVVRRFALADRRGADRAADRATNRAGDRAGHRAGGRAADRPDHRAGGGV